MSINTLDEFIAQVETTVKTVAGIRYVPDYLPEQISSWPAVVTYAARGYIDVKDFGLGHSLHDVSCDLLIPKRDQARDLATLQPFVTSIPAALAKDPLLTSFYGSMTRISYVLAFENYGGVDVVGYRFVIEKIKIDS